MADGVNVEGVLAPIKNIAEGLGQVGAEAIEQTGDISSKVADSIGKAVSKPNRTKDITDILPKPEIKPLNELLGESTEQFTRMFEDNAKVDEQQKLDEAEKARLKREVELLKQRVRKVEEGQNK